MRRQREKRREGFRRYHVQIGIRRTTVTLDQYLSDWLALHLDPDLVPNTHDQPELPEAHRAIRNWMQAQLDHGGGADCERVAHWLYCRALETVMRPELRKRRDELALWGLVTA